MKQFDITMVRLKIFFLIGTAVLAGENGTHSNSQNSVSISSQFGQYLSRREPRIDIQRHYSDPNAEYKSTQLKGENNYRRLFSSETREKLEKELSESDIQKMKTTLGGLPYSSLPEESSAASKFSEVAHNLNKMAEKNPSISQSLKEFYKNSNELFQNLDPSGPGSIANQIKNAQKELEKANPSNKESISTEQKKLSIREMRSLTSSAIVNGRKASDDEGWSKFENDVNQLIKATDNPETSTSAKKELEFLNYYFSNLQKETGNENKIDERVIYLESILDKISKSKEK